MSDTRIKICGITNLADARYAAGAGADYLGFILYEESPRAVQPDFAKEILGWIHGPKTVGVFVNASPETVNTVAAEVGFDLVQLHGTESPEECARISCPVIKVLHVTEGTTTDHLRRQAEPYREVADHILLDSRTPDAWGGTGTTFDWSVCQDLGIPVFLAGGLRPGNVAEAVRTARPFCVDVSSGVEDAPGRKDFELIDAFVEAVKST